MKKFEQFDFDDLSDDEIFGKQNKNELLSSPPREDFFVFKKTDDDWCGNYNEDEVILFYNIRARNRLTKYYVVGVWGNDDTGYNKFFDDPMEALDLFNFLNSLDKINFEDCARQGMDEY